MIYKVILKPEFEDDVKQHFRFGNKKFVVKVGQFLDEQHITNGLKKGEPPTKALPR